MGLPVDIPSILSWSGVPAGAIGLAYGLVRGAGILEKDASDDALKYVSGLLTSGNLANFGKLGAPLVPLVFDRIFGTRPLSRKFITRSILSTTVFWLVLLAVKHPTWGYVWGDLSYHWIVYCLLFPHGIYLIGFPSSRVGSC